MIGVFMSFALVGPLPVKEMGRDPGRRGATRSAARAPGPAVDGSPSARCAPLDIEVIELARDFVGRIDGVPARLGAPA